MADKFYISTCPDTGRVFICESGIDNNIAEVFAQNNKTVADNARLVCGALNSDLVISGGTELVGPLLSDVLPRLVDWIRGKIESHRIDFENDAPYLEGMLEDIEECVEANNNNRGAEGGGEA